MWQRSWIIERGAHRVQLKGEWITLSAMMIIFAAGFVNGFLSVVMPALATSALFAVIFIAATCLPAGQFLGRGITTMRTPVVQAS